MTEKKTMVIRGKASYAKILGDPAYNKFNDENEWSIDLVIDKDSVKELKAAGIGEKIKQKDDYVSGAPFLTFRQKEFRKNGKKNDPIAVTDIFNRPWDQSKLIGNDSVLDVKFDVVSNGPGKKDSTYIRGVRVLEHVPYERKVFSELSEDDEYMQKAIAAEAAAAEDD